MTRPMLCLKYMYNLKLNNSISFAYPKKMCTVTWVHNFTSYILTLKHLFNIKNTYFFLQRTFYYMHFVVIFLVCVCLHLVVSNTYCVVFFFVSCARCCQFLWIVHLWMPLRYSLTFILGCTQQRKEI